MAIIGYENERTSKKVNVLTFNEWLLSTHNYLLTELDEEDKTYFMKEYVYEYITEQIDKLWAANHL